MNLLARVRASAAAAAQHYIVREFSTCTDSERFNTCTGSEWSSTCTDSDWFSTFTSSDFEEGKLYIV